MADYKLTRDATCAGCAAKLNQTALSSILSGLDFYRAPETVLGMEDYDDAGVFRLKDGSLLLQTLDFFPPIVDDPFSFGMIAAANSLSDIYAMGGIPLTALNICCFPADKYPPEVFTAILQGGGEKLREAKCTLLGGHTVVDDDLKFGVSVSGIAQENEVVSNAAAKPGELLILTKPLGTGIATTALKADLCPLETAKAAINSMEKLNKASRNFMVKEKVRCATDITGFGLAGHALEICRASKVSMVFHLDDIPVFPHIYELISMGLMPAGSFKNKENTHENISLEGKLKNTINSDIIYDAQTSGGVLFSLPPEPAKAAEKNGIGKIIGEITENKTGRRPLITIS